MPDPAERFDVQCACGQFECVCYVIRDHAEGCPFRTSMLCPVGVECEHGFDVCPKCDPCTCKEPAR